MVPVAAVSVDRLDQLPERLRTVFHFDAEEALARDTIARELADPAARFRAVTGDAVQELAAECLDPGRRAEGVVRGEPSGAL